MAQLGKISKRVLDAHGNPISGATVEIRTQGAFVTSSQSGPTYTVNDPGGIVAATSTCVANTTTAPSRACTAATASTVTFGILGLGSLTNNDRISVSSPLPTLYADAQQAETKTNPLTTDANGYCYAWAPVLPYDLKISATGYGTTLETDVMAEGQEYVGSNLFQGAAATAFRRGTTRTLTSGRITTFENPLGTIKAEVDYDGSAVFAGNLSVTGTSALTGNVTVTGNETVGGTLGVTGATTTAAITAGGLITANAGITSAAPFTYSGAAGSFSLTAGSIETADLATQCTTATASAQGTTDQTITAAAAYADIVGDGNGSLVSVSITPASTSSEIVAIATIPFQGTGGAAQVLAKLSKGGTVVHESGAGLTAGATDNAVVTLIYRGTGLSGAQVFTCAAKCTTTNTSILSNSTDKKARLIVMEFKK